MIWRLSHYHALALVGSLGSPMWALSGKYLNNA
jgi:hypothetical protein